MSTVPKAAQTQATSLNHLARTLDGEKASACGGIQAYGFLDDQRRDIVTLRNLIPFYEDKHGECHNISSIDGVNGKPCVMRHRFGVGNVEKLDIEYRSA